ncbi:MAG: dihydropteroate synthase [Candidatus Aminicenantes bacterium]
MRKELKIQVRSRDYLLGQRTWIMGVLNVTPDSFSDGGRYLDRPHAVDRGLEMWNEGADIVDIGGESTRPGAAPVPVEEELARVIPVIREIRRRSDVLISIDTTKSRVLAEAWEAGADILNDISAMRADPEMLPLAAKRQVPVILMHMRGTPQTMQNHTGYADLLAEIKSFFSSQIIRAVKAGLKKERLIIDPGIGFAKTQQQNLQLIRNLDVFSSLEVPVLIGVSKKSFLGRILNLPPEERVEGTIAASLLAMQAGAHILRVHDVAAVNRAVRTAEAILAQPVASGPREPGSKGDEQYAH